MGLDGCDVIPKPRAIFSVNDGISDLMEELKCDGQDQVVTEIKAVLEETDRQGGCGATPGQVTHVSWLWNLSSYIRQALTSNLIYTLANLTTLTHIPFQAHGGDFTGGDCLNIINKQHRFLELLPVTWPRKVAWTRYFLMMRLVLPPLMRTRFWTDDEITIFEVGSCIFSCETQYT